MNSITQDSEQASIREAAATIRAEANIGRLLQDAGKLKPEDMDRVLRLQQEKNLRFGAAAQQLGLVSEADIQQALSQQFEYPYIPAGEASLSPELTAATSPYSREAEALRSVRAELLLRWFQEGRRTLAVGSTRSNEGASYVAANLAVLFAQLGRRVMLVDANMREPHLQTIFNFEGGRNAGMGLSDYLAGRTPSLPVEAVKSFPTLSVLLAGSPPPNPAELLARPAFGALLATLEKDYDVVIVDTAPGQTSSDFQLIAAHVGGMLVVTRRNVGRLTALAEFKEKIVFAGAQVVGAVVLD